MSTSLRPGSQDADNRPVHTIPLNGIRPSPSMPPPRQPPFSRDPGINTSNQIEDPLEWNMNVEDDSSRFFDFDEWLSLGASASTSGSADKDRTPLQQPKDSSKQGNAIQSSTSAHPTTPDWGREATWEDIASSYDQHGAGVGASDHGFARNAEASWYPLTDTSSNLTHHQSLDPSTFPFLNPNPPGVDPPSPSTSQQFATLSPPFATDLLAFLASSVQPTDQVKFPPIDSTPLEPPLPTCRRCSTTHSSRFTDIGDGMVVCNACRLFVMSHRRQPKA